MPGDVALDASDLAFAGFDLRPFAPLVREASRLGLALRHSPYDCLYLVLAEQENVPFVTNDRRFLAKLTGRQTVPLLDLTDLPERLP